MKTISQWASRHVRPAILLIILCEFANGFNGVLLGANLLDNIPLGWLQASIFLVIATVILIHLRSGNGALPASYWLVRRRILIAFVGNFLLFGLLGGIWAHRLEGKNPAISTLGNRRTDIVRDTLAPDHSLTQPTHTVNSRTHKVVDEPTGGRRLGYILLGILGIGVAFLAAGLACNIACAGNGFFAVLAVYLGLGGLAGSVYFFRRAGQKTLKRRQEMTAQERKRDSRWFWLTWLIMIGTATALFLAGAFSSK